jgi:putative ABC transport system permease protein
MLLGLRLVGRRTRRTILTTASLTIAVTMVVAALTLAHQVAVHDQSQPSIGLTLSSSVGDRVTHVVIVLAAVLVVLAAINGIFTTWALVIDAQRSTALARALGATPRQIIAALTTAQLLPALVAALIGIPAGVALFGLAGGNVADAGLPVLWLLGGGSRHSALGRRADRRPGPARRPPPGRRGVARRLRARGPG